MVMKLLSVNLFKSNLQKNCYLLSTIIHKIFVTNSGFHVEQHTTGKVQFLFFRRFLLVLAKVSLMKDDLAPGNCSMKLLIFPNFLRS